MCGVSPLEAVQWRARMTAFTSIVKNTGCTVFVDSRCLVMCNVTDVQWLFCGMCRLHRPVAE